MEQQLKLPLDHDLQSNKLNVLFAKFEKYCKPKQNVTVERYQLNNIMHMQETVEVID